MLTVVERGPASLEKPPQPVRGHAARLPWAWDGLCFALPVSASNSEGVRDIATNVSASTTNNLSWTTDNRGNAAVRLGDASYVQYPDNPRHDQPATELTIYVRLRFRGGADSDSYGGIITNRYFWDAPWNSYAMSSDVTPGICRFQVTINGTQYATDTLVSGLPTTRYVNLFGRWRTGDTMTLDCLKDGGAVEIAQAISSIHTGTIPYQAGETMWVGCAEQFDKNFGADYSQVLVWSRRLSDTEVQALAIDPYGWCSPRRETVVVAGSFPLVVGAPPQWVFGQVTVGG